MEALEMRKFVFLLALIMTSTAFPGDGMAGESLRHICPQSPAGQESREHSCTKLYGLISYEDVAVIYNVNSEISRAIAENFTLRRGIPPENVIGIDAPVSETVSRAEFEDMREQIEGALVERNLTGRLNYLVTTKGVPLRVWGPTSSASASVDAELALILGPYSGYIGGSYWLENPYFGDEERFTRAKYGFFLVTRLTGYDLKDCLALINRSEMSGGRRGVFLLDKDPGKGGGYAVGNQWLDEANRTLSRMGYATYLDDTDLFVTDFANCSGYASWGSNDAHYSTTWNTNPGFESGETGWQWSGEGSSGVSGEDAYRGRYSFRILKNTPEEFILWQNVSVREGVAYYISGYVNLTGGEVHLSAEVYSDGGDLLVREEGSALRGPTTSWRALRQLPLKPLPPASATLRLMVNVSGSGSFYLDEIRVQEIKPHNSWVPGAIAETFVSTSGRTFTWPPIYGQSLIADLIREGVSAVKGYVYEPYLSAIAEPSILFPRYVSGYFMAESYYMASPFLSWMGVVVGDPKMCPYGLQANITSARVLKDVVNPGEMVKIAVNVTNAGFGDIANVPLTLHIEGMDSLIIEKRVNLSRGMTSLVWFNFTAPPPGNYRARLVINGDGTLPFMNSSGGEVEVSFRVNSPPEIISMWSSSVYVRRGGSILLFAEVRDSDDGLLPLSWRSWIIGPGGVNVTLNMAPENLTLLGSFTPPLSWEVGFASLHLLVEDPWGGRVHGVLNDAFYVMNNPPGVADISWTEEVMRGSLFFLNLTLADPDTPPQSINVSACLERGGERVELEGRGGEDGTYVLSARIPAGTETGPYDIYLTLNDGLNRTELLYPEAVEVLNSPPSLELISSPPPAMMRGAMVTFEVSGDDLEDPRGLLELEVDADEGMEVSAERLLPGRWEVSLKVRENSTLGTAGLTLRVVDSDGGSSSPLRLTTLVINAPPSVKIISFDITSPGSRGDLLSTVRVVIDAADQDAEGEVELFLNFTGERTFQISLGEVSGRVRFQMEVWGNLSPGGWMIKAVAADRDGGRNATDWITFAITDSPPEILSARVMAGDGGALLVIHTVDPDLPGGNLLTLQILHDGEVIFEGPLRVGETTIPLNISSSVTSLTLNVSDSYACTTLTIPVTWPEGESGETGGGGEWSVLPVALAAVCAAISAAAVMIYVHKRRESGQR